MASTPMIKQWKDFKNRYPDAVLFFRAGDFYEMFFEDAKLTARELGIALTTRGRDGGKDVPLAGIPYHSLEPHLAKMVRKGYKVAICEQVEDPRKAKKLVKREVVRVVTPGTLMEDNLLEDKRSNYLAAVARGRGGFGLALVELSTGEFLVTEIIGRRAREKLLDELAINRPAEVIVEESFFEDVEEEGIECFPYRDEAFYSSLAKRALEEHFSIPSLNSLGLEGRDLAASAAGAALSYLKETQKGALEHISRLRLYSREGYMLLDHITGRNLELVTNLRDRSTRDTLLEVLDRTSTPMGGRLLKKWVLHPLKEEREIENRLHAVEELVEKSLEREKMEEELKEIKDLERIITRVSYGSSNARDLLTLKSSLAVLPEIKEVLKNFGAPLLEELNQGLDPMQELTSLLGQAIVESPPATVKEGGIIKEDYDEELDKLREGVKGSKDWIARLEESERRRTGINSLKVGYNSVFGYYIQVTKPNLDRVPEDYIRKQTLVNAERFITTELKEKEALILGSEEKINDREYSLFLQLRKECAGRTTRIQGVARAVARLDVLCSLASAAEENNFTRPSVGQGEGIFIQGGRHPVVEKNQEEFVPNSTRANREERLLIITGPNMAGKSTYLRQVALIVLLAQMGSFVPAERAEIGIVDRIFTRVGASDDLASGRSTFMVEMQETANILNNATSRSLVILDEIGRGTGTFDGLSIAWAVAEFLNREVKCKTLFATHYHQLAELEKVLHGVKNYYIEVEEEQGEVIFLRRIVEGSASRSYGIEVAKLAGLPSRVTENASDVLKRLEEEEVADDRVIAKRVRRRKLEKVLSDDGQKTLFETGKKDPLTEELEALDINNLTPLQALNKLAELAEKARREG